MKALRTPLTILLGLIVLTGWISCGQDRWPEYYPYTGKALWIDSVMRLEYLWYDEMPEFDDLNYFNAPATFLNNVKSSDDSFSSVDTIDNSLTGYGFDFTTKSADVNDTAYFAMVTYVIPGSPADEAGLERGDWVMQVDGTYFTSSGDSVLEDGDSRTLLVGRYTAYEETDTLGNVSTTYAVVEDRTLQLPAVREVEDAVIPVSMVIDGGVGYLVYNAFDADYNDELLAFADLCTQSGVTDVVIDLRYNEGGDLGSVELLATILAPSSAMGKTLASLVYNDQQTDKTGDITFDADLLEGHSPLGLSAVYFLTTSSTAGAAEMLMHCLSPYMDVVVIGQTTDGWYVGIEDFVSDYFQWALHLAVCYVYNADGDLVSTSGIKPDTSLNHLSDASTVLPLGNPDEALLSVALSYINGSSSTSLKGTANQSTANLGGIRSTVTESDGQQSTPVRSRQGRQGFTRGLNLGR